MRLATRLNTTKRTRVAVSLRLNASKPKFDPRCFYAREFWRRSSDIEAGRDEVLHLPREDNFEAPVHLKPILPPASIPVILGRFDHGKGIIRALVTEAAVAAQRLIVDAGQHRFMVVRTDEGLKAYSAACPHYGIDLADGGSDESEAYCPVSSGRPLHRRVDARVQGPEAILFKMYVVFATSPQRPDH
jgi:hypothetical protein